MATTKERVIGLWLDAEGGEEPKWIVSRDTEAHDGTLDSTTLRTFGEDDYDSAVAAAVEAADREGLPIIKTGRFFADRERFRERPHRCAKCGESHPEAGDQTDPANDETAVDSRGLVAPNEWVCGRRLADAE